MATDFFQRQDESRARTTRLLFLFGLGILALVGLAYLLVVFVFFFLENDADQPPPPLWNPQLLAVVAAGVVIVVTCGSLIKAGELSSGGKAVALMLDGQEVLGTTRDLKERRLLNIVEEMAIAAGVPVPPVYILPENSINAFAAGHAPGDVVVAVSRGCLNYLTRDELQGVLGHEFSHILNGDVRLNLRIVVLIFGIMALSQLGVILMQVMPRSQSSEDKKDSSGAIMLLGLGLYLLGLAGAFFGWLIQAAVSRQREFLADASAVQFTRNPDGIAGALKKIGGLSLGSRIKNPKAGEVSHLFLSDAFMGARFTHMFDTHPPLEARIRQLDPQFDGTFPEVKPLEVTTPDEKPTPRVRVPSILPGFPQKAAILAAGLADSAVQNVGQPQDSHIAYASDLEVDLPDVIRAAAQEPFSARALIYCLLLDQRPEIRQTQLAQLKAGAAPRDYQETMNLEEPVRQLPDAVRLPLVSQAMPALRQMSPQQYQVFRAQVEELIQADNQVSLFEYTLQCVLNRYLDADYNRKRPSVRFTYPAQVAPQTRTVLSLLAWEGHSDPGAVEAAFNAGMNTYSDGKTDVSAATVRERVPEFRLLQRKDCLPPNFRASLDKLAQAAPAIKRRVVEACSATILADQQVTVREAELLRAICATLDCPMPPFIGKQFVVDH
jgi:Zn-dependent protease with chaperone function